MELIRIRDKIVPLRGRSVILDFDLAPLYGMSTRQLRDCVVRHPERFPGDFLFVLTREEWLPMRRQFLQLKVRQRPFPTQPPQAFTGEGLIMLAGLLGSARAIEMSIALVRSLIVLQQSSGNEVSLRHVVKYDDLQEAMQVLISPPPDKPSAFIGIRNK